jgi:hypothetical protein
LLEPLRFAMESTAATYAPNLPELLILVLGISVAAALIKLGERLFQDGVREI